MSKILVTGGCGFIGSHLVDELIKGNNKVYVFDNLSTGKTQNLNNKAELIKININNSKVYQKILKIKPKYIFHLAAQTSIKKSQEEPKKDFKTNLTSILPILEASVKLNIVKFIFSSSAAVYGESKIIPVSEEFSKNPSSPYGISKLSAEYLIFSYAQRYKLPFTIFRYSNVYGPRQSASQEGGVVSIFINNLIKNKQISIYGSGKQTRDFIYVSDVVRANLLTLKNPHTGIFNVSTAKQISINYLYGKIAKLLKSSNQPKNAPPNFLEVQRSVLSFKKIKSKTGWQPSIVLDNGLEKTIQYFKTDK